MTIVSKPLYILMGFLLLWNNPLWSQWQNEIFRTPKIQLTNRQIDSTALRIEQFDFEPFKNRNRRKSNKPYLQLGALQYTKNNEYFQATNPGETIIGQRLWSVVEYQNSGTNILVTYSLGAVLQFPFDQKLSNQVQFKPIVRLTLQTPKSTIIAGNIDGHVNHNLPEAVYNYEWALKSPIEYGLAWNRNSKFLRWHSWLNWRQQAIIESSQQEIIVGGFSSSFTLLSPKTSNITNFSLEVPAFMIHQHQGGENLKQPQPIQNKNNSGLGLRLKTKTLQAEYYGIQSLDFSPQPQQPYKNGFGHLVNISYFIKQNHRLVGTYWNANEFHSPLGAPMYGCVNLNNPYKNIQQKEVIFLRYAYLKRWMNNTVSEFRLEPGLDLKTNDFLLSFGLYFRFIIGDWSSFNP